MTTRLIAVFRRRCPNCGTRVPVRRRRGQTRLCQDCFIEAVTREHEEEYGPEDPKLAWSQGEHDRWLRWPWN